MSNTLKIATLFVAILIVVQSQNLNNLTPISPLTNQLVISTLSSNFLNIVYPNFINNIVFSTVISDDKPSQKQVLNTIRPWDVNIYENIRQNPTQVNQQNLTTKRGGICDIKLYNFRQTISDHLISNNFNNDFLLPGTLISLYNSTDLFTGLIGIPVTPSKRNPFTTNIGNGITSAAITVTNPSELKNAIKYSVLDSATPPGSNITLDIRTSQQTGDALKALGLNTKIYQNLGLANSSPGNWAKQDITNKITIIMFQKFFSAAIDFPTNQPLIKNPTQFFLNGNYTIDDLYSMLKYGYWGSRNPPSFVNQINYGRLFVLTVAETKTTTALINKIKNNRDFNGNILNMNQNDIALSSLLSDNSVRTFSRGLFVTPFHQTIKTLTDLKQFFAPLTKQLLTVNELQPLSFSLINFMGRKVAQTQNRYYSLATCKLIQKVVMRVHQISEAANVQIKSTLESTYKFAFGLDKNGGTFDITNLLSTQSDLRISLRGKKSRTYFFGATYSSRLRFTIDVNGKPMQTKQVACKRCKQQFKDYYCRINLTQGTIVC